MRQRKGIAKIRAENNWEIQNDHHTGEVLHVAYRRSDTIESIRDGTFFHDKARRWLFFPAACILLILWDTGLYLFLLPYLAKNKSRKRNSEPDDSQVFNISRQKSAEKTLEKRLKEPLIKSRFKK